MKKLVIFDLDGTLLDTIADLAESTNHALKQLGYPTHDVETIRTFVGNGINKLLERALPLQEQTKEKGYFNKFTIFACSDNAIYGRRKENKQLHRRQYQDP